MASTWPVHPASYVAKEGSVSGYAMDQLGHSNVGDDVGVVVDGADVQDVGTFEVRRAVQAVYQLVIEPKQVQLVQVQA